MTEQRCKVDGCNKAIKSRSGGLCSMHATRWARHKTFEYVGHRPKPLEQTILERVIKSDGCWSWSGWIDANGYAKLRKRGNGALAIHRWMYQRYNGPLVDGMDIDHACGNRGCVNPAHLRQVTRKQNVEHFTKPLRSHNTSGYRGVYFTKEDAADSAREMRLALHTHNDLDRVV